MIWALVAFVVGAVLAWLLKPSRKTVEHAVAKAFEEAVSKAKEVENAPDDDISRRVNELRARGRAGK